MLHLRLNPELLGLDGYSVFTIGGAIALGIGINQNFPEGFAFMPLRRMGLVDGNHGNGDSYRLL